MKKARFFFIKAMRKLFRIIKIHTFGMLAISQWPMTTHAVCIQTKKLNPGNSCELHGVLVVLHPILRCPAPWKPRPTSW